MLFPDVCTPSYCTVLFSQSPFSVEPSVGTLGPGESVQVTVDFSPSTTGNHREDLLLHYHTGEPVPAWAFPPYIYI